MFFRISLSALIYLGICVPCMILSVPVVGLLLLTKWDGRTTIFGNAKWGRANDHFSTPTKGWWQEFKWLVYRNPVNNLMTKTLAVPESKIFIDGDFGIGEKKKGGFYSVESEQGFWEYYWIKPYGSRCIRIRIGWKLFNSDKPPAFVFAINFWKSYTGL